MFSENEFVSQGTFAEIVHADFEVSRRLLEEIAQKETRKGHFGWYLKGENDDFFMQNNLGVVQRQQSMFKEAVRSSLELVNITQLDSPDFDIKSNEFTLNKRGRKVK